MHRITGSAVIAGAVVLGVLVGGSNPTDEREDHRADAAVVSEHSPPAGPRSESGPLFGVQFS